MCLRKETKKMEGLLNIFNTIFWFHRVHYLDFYCEFPFILSFSNFSLIFLFCYIRFSSPDIFIHIFSSFSLIPLFFFLPPFLLIFSSFFFNSIANIDFLLPFLLIFSLLFPNSVVFMNFSHQFCSYFSLFSSISFSSLFLPFPSFCSVFFLRHQFFLSFI